MNYNNKHSHSSLQLLFVNYCLKVLLGSVFNVSVYSVARPPVEATPPLAYPVKSAAALSALDIERTSNSHEEESGVSPPSARAPRVRSNAPSTGG